MSYTDIVCIEVEKHPENSGQIFLLQPTHGERDFIFKTIDPLAAVLNMRTGPAQERVDRFPD